MFGPLPAGNPNNCLLNTLFLKIKRPILELRLHVLIFSQYLRLENVIKMFLIYIAYGKYIVNIGKKCPQLFWSIHLLDYSLPLFILIQKTENSK